MPDTEFDPDKFLAPERAPQDTFDPDAFLGEGAPTAQKVDAPQNWYDKLLDFAARGAHLGSGKMLKAAGHGYTDLVNGTADAGLDLFKRLSTMNKESLPPETFQGEHPASPSDVLQNQFGMKGLAAKLTGLGTQVAADPLSVLGSALDEASGPVGERLQGLGKFIFEHGPFRRVNSSVVGKFRNGTRAGATPFTDLLWNEGNPIAGGFNKSNPEIGEQITNLRKQSWEPIQNALKNAEGQIDLAPNLETKLKIAQLQEANDRGIEADKMSDPFQWLKSKLASRGDDRQNAVNLLKESVPDLSGVIDNTAKNLKTAKRGEAQSFFSDLIDDLAEGGRTPEELQDMAVAMGHKAGKSQPMGTNFYARNAMPNAQKAADMQAAQELGSRVNELIDEKLGGTGATAEQKARYSILRRGELPAWQEVMRAQNAPWITWMDVPLALAGGAAGSHSGESLPAAIATILAAKTAQGLHRSPSFNSGTSMLINNLGKTNIWDNMLRQGLTQRALNNQ